jgi:hypothetical protein
MAEIKIQEKRGTNWLPLVLGALLLLALLTWFATRDRAPETAVPAAADTTAATAPAAAPVDSTAPRTP